MYSILFHLSGIAILEICFYFYYIGPMETNIFKDKIKNLAYEPFNSYSSELPPLTQSQNDYIHLFFFNNNNNETMALYLKKRSEEGKKNRLALNEDLFNKTINYWCILVGTSLVVYVLQHKKVANYLKKFVKKNQQHHDDDDSASIELENLPLYRITEENEYLEEKIICTQKRKKIICKILYYLLFACFILGFQYFFFDNIVSKYNPLSIGEVKYILYKIFQPKLNLN